MWNPETYRDTDFGLSADETFEPKDELEDDDVPGPDEPFVMTVLGPIRPDEVGVALVREHLQWNPGGKDGKRDGQLDDAMAALQDLEAFFTVSGRTVVSATPAGAGRDAHRLLWMAQRAPVHIVGATGHLGGSKGADAREAIASDLEAGMDGTSARPGIAVIGDPGSASVDAAIEEIGRQCPRHDLPVLSLASPGRQKEAIDRLASVGVPAGRVIVGGAGRLPERAIGALIGEGAWLLFDGIGEDAASDQRQARLIVELAGEGNVDRLLLSHGYRRRTSLTGYGGRPGLSYIVEQFAVMLLEEGLEALDVRRMLVDNAVAALTTVATGFGAARTHREG